MSPRTPAPAGDPSERRVLVLNAGSSSLKHQLRTASGRVLSSGAVERIGEDGQDDAVPDHAAALQRVLARVEQDDPGAMERVAVVGHRVVHGGTRFTEATVVDDAVETGIEELSALAPLHNPPQLAGIRAVRALLPEVAQVVVFDTAFHATVPAVAHTYALPRDLARRHGVRRYGFHGTSHRYVSRRAAEQLGVAPERVRLVTCHIGNGVSVTAIRDGVSVDTSMGLSPLEGAVMGTRSGDLDPAVVFYLAREAGLDIDQLDDLLNRRSGLLGLTGESDVRAVRALADGPAREDGRDADARLALDVYAHRLRKYVAAYLGEVPGVRAVVFTGGVGENDARMREAVVGPLAHLGVGEDEDSPVRVLVVPTDEEAEIADQALAALDRPGRAS
jgi:acetate kinase